MVDSFYLRSVDLETYAYSLTLVSQKSVTFFLAHLPPALQGRAGLQRALIVGAPTCRTANQLALVDRDLRSGSGGEDGGEWLSGKDGDRNRVHWCTRERQGREDRQHGAAESKGPPRQDFE